MNKRVLSAAASAALVLTVATGCGGDGGGRPSVDEIADGIQGGALGSDVSDKVATCVAKAFHDSDLSDDALQAIVDNDKDYKGSKEDTKALSSVSSESVTKCMGVELPDTDQ
ncbi:hypothetical protein [Nocardioides sp. URHA0020]|uniref:hypothetical protein n=1 Tax=Nocardioides sp. URHA0020 TaxID=1380392 RepID=UPI00049123B1|nr:hypothetical protein [Nocardioides sp. URHA0020]